MKFVVPKIHRSNVYHLLNTILPTNHRHKAESDAMGIVIIVGLVMAMVFVVRCILDCTH